MPSSRHLVDPELAPLLDVMPPIGVNRETLAAIRQNILSTIEPKAPASEEHTERLIWTVPRETGEGDVRVVVYKPRNFKAPIPLLLHLHGGGFVFGTADMSDASHRAWAEATSCVVASVDYRLAPETRYPGALDDCFTALKWIYANAPGLGIDQARIAIRGDSSGGGLAAALALRARDEGGPPIAFQLLIYPMLDDRTGTTRAAAPFAGEFIWTAADNRFAWEAVLGMPPGPPTGVSPHAAPARATDLSGLPPTLIAAAALDLFVDENLDYARHLLAAGVATELIVAPGAYHGFDTLNASAAVSRTFTARCMEALKRAFGQISPREYSIDNRVRSV
jgi:acetyl esterase/lipase